MSRHEVQPVLGREADDLALGGVSNRAGTVTRSQLHNPPTVVQSRRVVDDNRLAAGSDTVNGSSTRCRGVDYHEISWTKDVAEIVEVSMLHTVRP